jgi:hypothetical protein
LMATGIGMFQSLKAGIASAKPAFIATAAVVKAAFGAIWEIVTVTFSSISAALGLTGGDFMATFMKMAAVATFAAKNWPEIYMAAFVKLKLWLVQAGANFAHLFTGVLPALFSWFTENWANIFLDAAAFVGVVFSNIGKNIKDAMSAIWDFIASGGTKSLEFAFTPLMDGFGTAITKLPDIPERAIGELEAKLQKESDKMGKALGSGLQKEVDANMAMLDDFRNQKVETPEVPPIEAAGDQTVEDEGEESKQRSVGASLDRGSTEALEAIFSANQEDKNAAAQVKLQQRIASATEKLAAKKEAAVPVAGAFA